MTIIKTFEDLTELCRKNQTLRRLAVAAGDDEHTLAAVAKAYDLGIASPILIGDEEKIFSALERLKIDKTTFLIYPQSDPAEAAKLAVELVRKNEADFLMKGNCATPIFLRAVIDKEKGLATDRLMTHCAILEVPALGRLIGISDSGMVPYPDLRAKKTIIENMVKVFRGSGYVRPKVAVLACIETVNAKMPETVEARELQEMNERGEIKDCLIGGPLSFDIAIDPGKAKYKNFEGPVTGDADILIVDNIHTGNILSKSLLCCGQAKMSGFLVGAIVPVVVSSRAATAEEKFFSILTSSAALGI